MSFFVKDVAVVMVEHERFTRALISHDDESFTAAVSLTLRLDSLPRFTTFLAGMDRRKSFRGDLKASAFL